MFEIVKVELGQEFAVAGLNASYEALLRLDENERVREREVDGGKKISKNQFYIWPSEVCWCRVEVH